MENESKQIIIDAFYGIAICVLTLVGGIAALIGSI